MVRFTEVRCTFELSPEGKIQLSEQSSLPGAGPKHKHARHLQSIPFAFFAPFRAFRVPNPHPDRPTSELITSFAPAAVTAPTTLASLVSSTSAIMQPPRPPPDSLAPSAPLFF